MQKQQLENLYWKKVKVPMMSRTGKVLSKQMIVDGLSSPKLPHKKFSQYLVQYHKFSNTPEKKLTSGFSSVSRQKKNSYLLRFAKQINVKVNYEPKFDQIIELAPKYKISHSQFQRRIDLDTEAKDKYLNATSEIKNSKCQKSHTKLQNKNFLTTRDLSQWRKAHHQMDFTKQILYNNSKQQLQSTGQKSFKGQKIKTDQNGKTQKTTSTIKRQNNIHDFSSYLPHKYLDIKPDNHIPISDLLKANLGIVKPYWNAHKSHVKFNTFRDIIKVKSDRSEQLWNNKLDYNPQFGLTRQNLYRKVEIVKTLPRQLNLVNSKYPSRMSQRNDYNLRKQQILKQQISKKLTNRSMI